MWTENGWPSAGRRSLALCIDKCVGILKQVNILFICMYGNRAVKFDTRAGFFSLLFLPVLSIRNRQNIIRVCGYHGWRLGEHITPNKTKQNID